MSKNFPTKLKYKIDRNELFKEIPRIFSKNLSMKPFQVRILSNLMVIVILSIVCIGALLLVSYSNSSNGGLKTNLESCHSDKECCCGQYCLAYRKYSACQCKSDRWWNSDLPYCRKRWIIKLYYSTFFKLNVLFLKEKLSAYRGECSNTTQCALGSNMVCLSNMCTCSDPGVNFWNGTYCGI